MHLLVFKPNTKFVLAREYLCDCTGCLQLKFGNYEHLTERKLFLYCLKILVLIQVKIML